MFSIVATWVVENVVVVGSFFNPCPFHRPSIHPLKCLVDPFHQEITYISPPSIPPDPLVDGVEWMTTLFESNLRIQLFNISFWEQGKGMLSPILEIQDKECAEEIVGWARERVITRRGYRSGYLIASIRWVCLVCLLCFWLTPSWAAKRPSRVQPEGWLIYGMHRPAVGPSVLAANWLPRMTKQPSAASQPEVASCSGPLRTDAFGHRYYYHPFHTGSFLLLANSSKNAFSSISYISSHVIHPVLHHILQSTYPSTQIVTSLISTKHSKALFNNTFIITSARLSSPFIHHTSLISRRL
jgi:hypothetical protein